MYEVLIGFILKSGGISTSVVKGQKWTPNGVNARILKDLEKRRKIKLISDNSEITQVSHNVQNKDFFVDNTSKENDDVPKEEVVPNDVPKEEVVPNDIKFFVDDSVREENIPISESLPVLGNKYDEEYLNSLKMQELKEIAKGENIEVKPFSKKLDIINTLALLKVKI